MYRYNVERNGRVCCRANDIKLLCAACAQCATDRAAAAAKPRRAVAAAAPAQQPAPPPAPDFYASVRAAHRPTAPAPAPPVKVVAAGQGAPPPPDFYAIVRTRRTGGAK